MFKNRKVLPGSPTEKRQGRPLEQREGAAVSELCLVWPYLDSSHLPPVYFFMGFPLALSPAFHSHVGSLQNPKGEQPRDYHCPQPTVWSESALCWRRKCAFWKSWRLRSLFSKHCISHQWVSSKLWEHLTRCGSVTFLSWGVGRLQWCGEQITGNLEVILLFPAPEGKSSQYWVFLQRRFWAAFLSLCRVFHLCGPGLWT